MARKKDIEVEEEKESEADRVIAWRKMFFTQVLGKDCTDEQIDVLVASSASPHQALDLRNRECSGDLIYRILA